MRSVWYCTCELPLRLLLSYNHACRKLVLDAHGNKEVSTTFTGKMFWWISYPTSHFSPCHLVEFWKCGGERSARPVRQAFLTGPRPVPPGESCFRRPVLQAPYRPVGPAGLQCIFVEKWLLHCFPIVFGWLATSRGHALVIWAYLLRAAHFWLKYIINRQFSAIRVG